MTTHSATLRHLVVVLGDQLDEASSAFDGFDPARDAILQMEVREEASYVPQHKRRIAFFFAAMRHFRDDQRARGRMVHYVPLDDPCNTGSFTGEIMRHAEALRPERLIVLEPGDWRVRKALKALPLKLEMREDRHFLCSHADFATFTGEHGRAIMETFYRRMRRRLDILVEPDGTPVGGAWNFDHDNRQPLRGPAAPPVPALRRFAVDDTTREVVAMVARAFPDNPGSLEDFALPVSRTDALTALHDFTSHRLEHFGRYQDAMRSGEPVLFHSYLSGPLNLHLLNPREVVDEALAKAAEVPLGSLEGFVRQIVGWREFVRGTYWTRMPDYAEANALEATLPMPRFYWTGDIDMHCLADAIGHTIAHAYAHHIERLMVLGLFCLLLGVRPYDVHRWHISMFWDAVDWVSLPNTLGMSQYGDGGIMGTKPYVASGRYIDRMSDHCGKCRYDPGKAVGEDACPFTTLYWDFLDRHQARFRRNPRMTNQYSNLARKDDAEMRAIRRRAAELKAELTAETFL
jgi:deoxyribodipyrimidine photolyase-related protein